jgi:hypothetical protein
VFIKQKVLAGKVCTFFRGGITRPRYSYQHFVVFIYAVRLMVEPKQWRSACTGERGQKTQTRARRQQRTHNFIMAAQDPFHASLHGLIAGILA